MVKYSSSPLLIHLANFISVCLVVVLSIYLKDKYNFFEDIKFVSEDQYYNFFDLEYKYDDVINDLEVIHTIGLI